MSVSAFAYADNPLIEPEEVYSSLASVVDNDDFIQSTQTVIIPNSSITSHLSRASALSIGLGSGNIRGLEYVEVRVDGISTGIVNVVINLTILLSGLGVSRHSRIRKLFRW